ncbi:Adhesion G-protein coupled receptor D2 [Manis javanica]|nr:Adhesion G-protein coupled receptor D2 [Manis javanica]
MGKARRALGAVCRRAATRRGAGHPVPPSGILVLSQDQDSLGGGFSARDAFSGNLTNFHLWVRALSPAQLHRARACAPPRDGLLLRWDLGDLDVTPSLLLRLPCPVPSEECPSWDPGPCTEGSLLCLQPHPLWIEPRRSSRHIYSFPGYWTAMDGSAPITGLQLSIHQEKLFFCPLCGWTTEPARGPPRPAVRRGETDLPAGPAQQKEQNDLPSEVQPPSSFDPRPGDVESTPEGGQHRGPRVHDAQRASRGARPHPCPCRVGRAFPPGPSRRACPATGWGSEPPCMQPGLSGVTVMHSWFSSGVFQHALEEPGLEPQAPGSMGEAGSTQRFLRMQVGSAIISSEVWDITGDVNTAVTFHLQHQAQAFPQKLVEPVCAFWNFSSSPDTGGSWATTGCSVAALHQDSTACFHNHSTNFAVLLQGP